MWLKKLARFALIVVSVVVIVVANISSSSAQLNYNPFTYDLKFEELQLYTNSNVPKAPVVIDGKEIFSVGKIDGNPAEERVALIRSELFEAIDSDEFSEVTIKEQGNLPVLYLTFTQSAPKAPSLPLDIKEAKPIEDRRYLFTVTKEDTIGRKSNRDTALDLKQKIELAIVQAKRERSPDYVKRQALIALALFLLALFGLSLIHI